MRVLERAADTRRALDKEREAGRTVGFVPTMGYLHDGHLSLVRRARAENDIVAVSIFVNPLQFGPAEDLAAYPRDLERDMALLEQSDVDVLFHPTVDEMYPDGRQEILVTVGAIGSQLCGASRPGHFDGVATVVVKLFNIVGSCKAYFGEKDFQQLVILQRTARALDLPVEVIGCPIVREADGLAMSSRNVYLNRHERTAALVLPKALVQARDAIAAGERDPAAVVAMLRACIASEPGVSLDYAACVDPSTLDHLQNMGGEAVLAVAARVGKARLIDNVRVTVTPAGAPIEGSR